MSTPLPQLVRWPLRSLGLEPGRSLSNANPTLEQVRSRREDQHASILEGLAMARSAVPKTAAGLTDHRALQRRHAAH